MKGITMGLMYTAKSATKDFKSESYVAIRKQIQKQEGLIYSIHSVKSEDMERLYINDSLYVITQESV